MSLPELTYDAPYVIKRKWWEFLFSEKYTLPQETAQDQERILELTLYVLGWCRAKGLVEFKRTDKDTFSIIPTPSKNIAGFANIVIVKNMRRMVFQKDLDEFIRLLLDNSTYTVMTEIQQLHVAIGASFEPYIVNLVINKTYRAFASLPVAGQELAWEDIHAEYPFFWIIMFINVSLSRYTEAGIS